MSKDSLIEPMAECEYCKEGIDEEISIPGFPISYSVEIHLSSLNMVCSRQLMHDQEMKGTLFATLM